MCQAVMHLQKKKKGVFKNKFDKYNLHLNVSKKKDMKYLSFFLQFPIFVETHAMFSSFESRQK